jgi:hypothetical protein
VIERQRRNRMHNFVNTGSEELSPRVIGERKRTLFSRDLNYLRDMALFWTGGPFKPHFGLSGEILRA